MSLKSDCSGNFKKLLVFSLHPSILLGCMKTRGLVGNTMCDKEFSERLIEKLSAIITSNSFKSYFEVIPDKMKERFDLLDSMVFSGKKICVCFP